MCKSKENDNALYAELQKVIDEKKQITNPLIEILRLAQDIFGYLPVEVQEYIAAELGIPVSQVYGVVTFYNFFSMKPRGKHIINVCTGTACFVKGAPRILQMLADELGIQIGDTTEDRQFSLSAVRCVGACSLAPVFVIGEETYGRVDNRDKLKEIIDKYRN
ncbi:MAG: NAD(P)H-dependent oxidoreductase subunit E [Candidatus Cloacimonadales bacterium]|jgi:NADH:ubiquinone oxidoreductase subunit E|nr:NAD(P)H-dependent oxidoreductase subunit E [Candidatus Cloacimonadota bacterium]MDD2650036.1 NAD(P)H-dependent oxidoreductase subunit E [Candidatus Cloacimonadota bacterium]MDD3501573.1 NAD(P)H-dependent oxidoreductase subunit E [Candidatus Cloacimonadota bacterium]MDX9976430.1 NAD(P)H-dependent oxidoreductase subunit E [Candidatus Cloacimonadales bacterium]